MYITLIIPTLFLLNEYQHFNSLYTLNNRARVHNRSYIE